MPRSDLDLAGGGEVAGVFLLLSGCLHRYAAALAQKDKHDNSESWTVKAPPLGEPASPIAEPDDSWITEEGSDLEQAATAIVRLDG